MSLAERHLRQWEHNRALLSVLPASHPDWMITAVFYTALHAIEALLSVDGVSTHTHSERNAALSRTQRYSQIWKAYRPLYDLAAVSRYTAEPARWIAADQIKSRVVRSLLYPIESSVRKLLEQRDVVMEPFSELNLQGP